MRLTAGIVVPPVARRTDERLQRVVVNVDERAGADFIELADLRRVVDASRDMADDAIVFVTGLEKSLLYRSQRVICGALTVVDIIDLEEGTDGADGVAAEG